MCSKGDPIILPVFNESWSVEDKRNVLEYFEFIYCLAILSRTLLYLKNVVANIRIWYMYQVFAVV